MFLEGAARIVRSRLASSVVLLVTCAVAGACSDANQTVTGGELRFDAALPVSSAVDGGPNLCFKGDAANAPTTWTSLYADYFGGSATCSLNSGCHGSKDETAAGYQASHYVCPKNDKDACFAGITDPGAQFSRGTLNIALVNVAEPNESGLFKILRKVNGGASGGNRMPQSPTCYFSEADVSRILKWMGDGAKND